MGFPSTRLSGVAGAGPEQPVHQHQHTGAASLWQGAGKAELWCQSPASQNLVPTEVTGHVSREQGDAGIPFTGANWSKLAEMQEESPWRTCSLAALGICLTIREDEGGGIRSLRTPRPTSSGGSGVSFWLAACLWSYTCHEHWLEGDTRWMGSVSHPNPECPIPSSADLPLTKRSAECGVGGTQADCHERVSPKTSRMRCLGAGDDPA